MSEYEGFGTREGGRSGKPYAHAAGEHGRALEEIQCGGGLDARKLLGWRGERAGERTIARGGVRAKWEDRYLP